MANEPTTTEADDRKRETIQRLTKDLTETLRQFTGRSESGVFVIGIVEFQGEPAIVLSDSDDTKDRLKLLMRGAKALHLSMAFMYRDTAMEVDKLRDMALELDQLNRKIQELEKQRAEMKDDNKEAEGADRDD